MFAANRGLTFPDYLEYDDGTDNFYELVDGALVEVTPASPLHSDIAEFLDRTFYAAVERAKLSWKVKRSDTGVRTGSNRSRLPDVCVLKRDDWEQLRQQQSKSAVLRVPLLLAVEIVSPGEQNYRRDYIEKRADYQQRHIPEYWIVDPHEGKVTLHLLQDDLFYPELPVVFEGDAVISSPMLTQLDLSLTVAEVLDPDI
ncbi:MAG TPA: Uma2 family endonuclease [Leptolyngbyaceae cyanobacterium M33_DOE_097]|uniref:Uma2 family endonuclease n=1 Tax=Oscillatoriales cyanobacterium SpSt-418 TaxID=2282169 RepID=A0A7C3KDP9_9CYAN|nr:Uma2 family endonuclease [Leptolyngbyaceae cyanobacterium M33_DOE_097]